jgi:phosphoribosyl 1,2-cyclic phosphodiesterase
MALYYTSINSGSNGNCYYVGNEQEAILVDAGITCREIEKRMKRLGLPISKVRAILISHEHGDHISGVTALSRKHNLPVYITAATLRESKLPLCENLVVDFNEQSVIKVGALTIKAFKKNHDAIDPYSFVITHQNVCVGVFTDIGHCCNSLAQHFSQCHAVFLEANYCEQMLANGRYPYFLKNRIKGGYGHLSNTEALQVFERYKTKHLQHLVLSHLSKNNNHPAVVEAVFSKYADKVKITVASRYNEMPLYNVTATVTNKIKHKVIYQNPRQLCLAL